MLFQTYQFLIFFIILLLVLSFFNKESSRKRILVCFSYLFYMYWNPFFIFLLLLFTSFNYVSGNLIYKSQRKKGILIFSVVFNLSILIFFKYFHFLKENIETLFQFGGYRLDWPTYEILLPIGISFFTFEAISYNVDIYKKEIAPAASLLDFALFISFFPRLISGPIVRPSEFLPQLNEPKKIKFESTSLLLITKGLVKKVLIADNLSVFVDTIYKTPELYPSIIIWIAAIGFTVQIYCDFSGYTDMAIGIARILGFQLPTNFKRPYFASNPSDFWKKWHITLSSWLKDYLYIPLGGNRKGAFSTYRNLFITMLLGGLWHGASWNFLLWGAIHGILLIVYKIYYESRIFRSISTLIQKHSLQRLSKIASILFFQYLIVISWIPFRIESTDQMLITLKKFILFDFKFSIINIGLGSLNLLNVLAILAIFLFIHYYSYKKTGIEHQFSGLKPYQVTILYSVLGLMFLIFWPSNQSAFIYFQF
jgi:alginate O-acetyltransferase complex protein AlgI